MHFFLSLVAGGVVACGVCGLMACGDGGMCGGLLVQTPYRHKIFSIRVDKQLHGLCSLYKRHQVVPVGSGCCGHHHGDVLFETHTRMCARTGFQMPISGQMQPLKPLKTWRSGG